MIFLANRANLDRRTLLGRLHKNLASRADAADSPVETIRYHTSDGNKEGVRARIDAPAFLNEPYPVDDAELQISFDFPDDLEFDWYRIQWVESARNLMVGWHQDETHVDLGECHLQVDFEGKTVQREEATYLDMHPLNVFDARMNHLPEVLDALTWRDDTPHVPERAIR